MGRVVSEETKKKISEALKKRNGNRQPPDKKSALQASYDDSSRKAAGLQGAMDRVKAKVDALKASKKKLSPQQKAELKKQIATIKAQMEGEKKRQAAIKEQAGQVKSKEAAAKRVGQAEAVLKKAAGTEKKIRDAIAKAKKPEQKARYEEQLGRLAAVKSKQGEIIKAAKASMNAKGPAKSKASLFVDRSTVCFLDERGYHPWRTLTPQERRANLRLLNSSFNDLQNEFQAALKVLKDEELQRTLKRIKTRLDAGDIAGIAAISVVSINKFKALVSEYLKRSYEIGKKSASEEIKVERPTTPTFDTQLMNFEAEEIAEDVSYRLNKKMKQRAREGLSAGVAAVAIYGSISSVIDEEMDSITSQISSTVVAQGIGDGRRMVFEDNVDQLQGYQRSEVLDDRTCNVCISLDGRIVPTDDPMANLTEVHSNCRGIWIPVLNGEEVDGTWGIPKTVRDNFDTVGGTPMTNSFKAMKNPERGQPFQGPGAAARAPKTADDLNFVPPYDQDDIPLSKINYRFSKTAEEVKSDIDMGKLSKTPGPILVVKEKDGYHILDGAHRMEEAKLAGKKTIEARIVDAKDYDTYGGAAWNNVARPKFTIDQAADYNGLDYDGRSIYDNLRTKLDISHDTAIEEAQKFPEYADQVKAKTITPMGGGDVEHAVFNLIKDKTQK